MLHCTIHHFSFGWACILFFSFIISYITILFVKGYKAVEKER
ncbi:DUF2651 family protein [Bacillus toyonensis]